MSAGVDWLDELGSRLARWRGFRVSKPVFSFLNAETQKVLERWEEGGVQLDDAALSALWARLAGPETVELDRIECAHAVSLLFFGHGPQCPALAAHEPAQQSVLKGVMKPGRLRSLHRFEGALASYLQPESADREHDAYRHWAVLLKTAGFPAGSLEKTGFGHYERAYDWMRAIAKARPEAQSAIDYLEGLFPTGFVKGCALERCVFVERARHWGRLVRMALRGGEVRAARFAECDKAFDALAADAVSADGQGRFAELEGVIRDAWVSPFLESPDFLPSPDFGQRFLSACACMVAPLTPAYEAVWGEAYRDVMQLKSHWEAGWAVTGVFDALGAQLIYGERVKWEERRRFWMRYWAAGRLRVRQLLASPSVRGRLKIAGVRIGELGGLGERVLLLFDLDGMLVCEGTSNTSVRIAPDGRDRMTARNYLELTDLRMWKHRIPHQGNWEFRVHDAVRSLTNRAVPR